jgi:nitrile hydratase subunit beta
MPALPKALVWDVFKGGMSARADVPDPPRFTVGDRVIARNINTSGHTRLPRYVRGKQGVVHHHYGGFVFADTRAHGLGDQPQHLYSVRFEARELWGKSAPARDAVYSDLWDSYVEPAS